MLYANEGGEIHRLKKRIGGLLPTLREFDGKKPIALLTFLSQLREGINAIGVSEAAAVRVLAFLLAGNAKSFYDSITMSGTRSRTVTQTYTCPHVVHSLIDRYLTDTELQNAYDRVTLIAQRTNETENEYADRISEAARDCANVFEDHALVHYYVRGLPETTLERVIEDLRRLPEKERHYLTAVRRLAMAQGKHVYGTNGSRRTTMDYDVNGLERTINALETSFIGIRFTIQYRPGIVHQVPDALSRIISPQGNDDRPFDYEAPTYGDHENVFVTTRTRKCAANVTKTASERTPRTNDSGNVRKRNEKRQRPQKQMTNAYEDDEQRVIRELDENVHGNDAENEDEALDEVLDEDLDIFDLGMAYRDGRTQCTHRRRSG